MGRRSKSEELQFGSDSFLDVIANMVGILIILIVVVGIHVAKSPPSAASVQREIAKREQRGEDVAVKPFIPLPEKEPAAESEEKHAEEKYLEPPPEIQQKVAMLGKEAQGIEKQIRKQLSASEEMRETYHQQLQQIAQAKALLASQAQAKESAAEVLKQTTGGD